MSDAPALWASLREARPALVPHARLHRLRTRGEGWAVLSNGASGVQVRLNDAALELVRALDGRRTLGELLEGTFPEADAALREALAETLLTLESGGLVRLGRPADSARLIARAEGARRRRLPDPLALRVPLHDPDAWLERLAPRLGWLFGPPARGVALALVALALLVAFTDAAKIAATLERLAGEPARWWLYALLWPPLKLVHELAHALLVKRHGGAVHEAGVALLVLMPVPYVDASDSAGFERRAARIAVAAAGMVAEGVLAAAALVLWSVTEAGLVNELAFAAALLGSVSTIVFNANPLLRFDGYQILQDALDMPNLGSRANAYLGWLLRRRALGARTGRSPVSARRERRWLIGYALSSLAYRWVLTGAIALYLAGTVPLVGVPLALFALYRLALRPLLRGLRYLAAAEELAGRRRRAALVSAAAGGAVALAVGVVPLPSSTRLEGVVRAPSGATLHARAAGRVAELAVPAGAAVRAGEPVLRLAAPELHARREVLAAELATLVTRRGALLARDPAEAARLALDVGRQRDALAALDEDIAALEVRAPRDGRFAPRGARLDLGHPVTRGEVLGHVVGGTGLAVETVLDQRAVGRVRAGVRAARVRLASAPTAAHPATLSLDAPAGDRRLPSAALAFDGTRGIAVASEGGELRTLEPVFRLELALPDGVSPAGVGERAYVTLAHAPEPLARRWWRAARQLFLEKLSV